MACLRAQPVCECAELFACVSVRGEFGACEQNHRGQEALAKNARGAHVESGFSHCRACPRVEKPEGSHHVINAPVSFVEIRKVVRTEIRFFSEISKPGKQQFEFDAQISFAFALSVGKACWEIGIAQGGKQRAELLAPALSDEDLFRRRGNESARLFVLGLEVDGEASARLAFATLAEFLEVDVMYIFNTPSLRPLAARSWRAR